jgi:hypothetical protein
MNKIPSTVRLSIAHHIFLTREQRYALHDREKIRAIGVSLPVWFYKGATSEPGEEVFCDYLITNRKGEDISSIKLPVVNTDPSYTINLPQIPEDYEREVLTNDEWRVMSIEKRRKWYQDNIPPMSSKNLLDFKDGGAQYLSFKVIKTDAIVYWEEEHQAVKFIHFIVLKDISELTETLTDI